MKVLAMLIMSLFVLTTFHGTLAVVDEPLPGEAELQDLEDSVRFGPTEQEKATPGRDCEEGEKLCLEGDQGGPWLAGTQAFPVLSDVCVLLADQMSREFYELLAAPVCEAEDPLEDLPDPPVPIPFVSTDVEHERHLGFHGAGFSLDASFGFSGMGMNLTGEATVNATAEIGSGDISPAEPGQVPCRDPRGCPDLHVDASRLLVGSIEERTFTEDDCAVEEESTQPGDRRLLRFTFAAPNLGRGDLIIGAPDDHPEWFEWGDCHRHWHFESFADYRLWTPDGYAQWQIARSEDPDATAEEVLADNPGLEDELVGGHKQAFCLMDVRVYVPFSEAQYRSCASNQGISVGWADEYHHRLDGQWVDITDVEPGLYVLEAEVNPNRVIQESDYSNNAGAILVNVPQDLSIPPVDPPLDALEDDLECDDCLPDLSVDPVRLASSIRYTTQTFSETDCNVKEGNTEPGTRNLIRFTTKLPNLGNASLTIGDPEDSPDLFEWGECHEHWHFIDFVDHRLWNRTAYEEWRTLRDAQPERPADEILDDNPNLRKGLVSGHKMGFCLIDIERAFFVYPTTPRHHTSCTDQGISAGWADVYGSHLDGQFIDITGVEPGLYVLELEVNPGRTVDEGDYTNNDTAIHVMVP